MFSINKLAAICDAKKSDFIKYGKAINNPTGLLVYQDNDAPILAVAHLDIAIKPEKAIICNEEIMISPAMDDRLGAYLILDVLQSYGLKFDVLLTDCEERANSTAQFYNPDKEYNWIFEFDRSGNDVVMYNYDNDDLRLMLKEFDFQIGIGSFTDICWMEHLGVKGINFGTCYYNPHSRACYADLYELELQVYKFIAFYHKYKDVKFPHEQKEDFFIGGNGRYKLESWDSNDYFYDPDLSPFCEFCGDNLIDDFEMDYGLCQRCLEYMAYKEG